MKFVLPRAHAIAIANCFPDEEATCGADEYYVTHGSEWTENQDGTSTCEMIFTHYLTDGRYLLRMHRQPGIYGAGSFEYELECPRVKKVTMILQYELCEET